VRIERVLTQTDSLGGSQFVELRQDDVGITCEPLIDGLFQGERVGFGVGCNGQHGEQTEIAHELFVAQCFGWIQAGGSAGR